MHAMYSHTENTYIHKNESKHSEMGPVRQNPIQRTVRSVHVCALHCAQLLHTILHRTDLIISPSYPPDNHHCSDDVCLREGGEFLTNQQFTYGVGYWCIQDISYNTPPWKQLRQAAAVEVLCRSRNWESVGEATIQHILHNALNQQSKFSTSQIIFSNFRSNQLLSRLVRLSARPLADRRIHCRLSVKTQYIHNIVCWIW